jgi:hypothetical protein
MSQQQPDSEPPTVKHTVEKSPDEVLKHWTAEKMRKAKPARMPHIAAPDHEKQQTPRPPQSPDSQKS